MTNGLKKVKLRHKDLNYLSRSVNYEQGKENP